MESDSGYESDSDYDFESDSDWESDNDNEGVVGYFVIGSLVFVIRWFSNGRTRSYLLHLVVYSACRRNKIG